MKSTFKDNARQSIGEEGGGGGGGGSVSVYMVERSVSIGRGSAFIGWRALFIRSALTSFRRRRPFAASLLLEACACQRQDDDSEGVRHTAEDV